MNSVEIFNSETAVWNNPRMKSEDISYMSWEQQHVHGVKRMLYFYTQLARNMKWDFTSTRTAEMEFLPRYYYLFYVRIMRRLQKFKKMLSLKEVF